MRSQFTIKLTVFKQKVLYSNIRTILYQLRVRNTVSKHKWRYKLQNVPVAAPPPARKPISYLQYEKNCTCQQSSPCFAWILPIAYALYIIFPIIDQWRYFFTFMKGPDPQMFFDFEQNKYQNLIQKEYGSLRS